MTMIIDVNFTLQIQSAKLNLEEYFCITNSEANTSVMVHETCQIKDDLKTVFGLLFISLLFYDS